ncbi:4-alpha-glucanotransferase [Bisgaardia hudsonensis]|uniref:4-alpha-glucanotransferase n=1 Tax=Bisgaardia hudsonensis TaxID=109472 RepID=UPI003AB94A7A
MLSKQEKAFSRVGIMPYFLNERGLKIRASTKVRKIFYKNLKKSALNRRSLIPTVKIFYEKQPHFLPLAVADKQNLLQGKWELKLENNVQTYTGKIKRNSINFPRELPLGYHDLYVTLGKKQFHSRIIVAPKKCYQPAELQQGKKLWGTFIQLYTLRSEHNWGIGDFSDLKEFLYLIKDYHADFVGLNPIHALFPANPECASPYSPSSRKWINIIYIDVEQIPEFQTSEVAQKWFYSSEVQQSLDNLRACEFVNYTKVIELKLKGLKLAFDFFQEKASNIRHKQFEKFIQENGESLQIQGTFDALHQYFSQESGNKFGWDYWQKEYQDYHSDAVQEFRKQHINDVLFYMWLQFCADQQLKECYNICLEQKMPIGLYRDLAVGVTNNGAETWFDKQLYCLNVSVGAPPDVLAPQGQNWGLSPINPHKLKQRAYQPFIELVRANMKHSGALRIDHIMSLLRLWWIPKNKTAKDGVYIRYPVDDLLAILALESHRHNSLIIGEDLGTVPKEIISKLKNAGILSYKIFYFEFDSQGNSRNLKDYPYQAMTTLSTHDLPTVNGYWRGYDFELGQRFGIYPNSQVLSKLKIDRIYAKSKILERLQENNINVESEINETLSSCVNKKFNHQLQHYVANVSSALFGLQPEDWLDMTEPVNIPGTSDEYANWRRKLTKTVAEIFSDTEIKLLLQGIRKKRHVD